MGSSNGWGKTVAEPSVRRYRPGMRPGPDHLLVFDAASLSRIHEDPNNCMPEFSGQAADRQVSLVVLSDACIPPLQWIDWSEDRGVLLCVSRHDVHLLTSRLIGLVREKFYDTRMVHAGLMIVNGRGVLLVGEAGAGKTECAIELVAQGHEWVADDAVILKRTRLGTITGRPAEATQNLVYRRGKGILPITECASRVSVKENVTVDLIVEMVLEAGDHGDAAPIWDTREIMDIPVPHVRLVHQGRGGDAAARLLDWLDLRREGDRG